MRLRTIETLLRLARQAEDRARVEARGRRKALDDSTRLSHTLRLYAGEYSDQLVANGVGGEATADELDRQSAFKRKLDRTRIEQSGVIDNNQASYNAAIEFVSQNQMRTRIFEGLESRARAAVRRRAERAEQAVLDDLVNSRRNFESSGTEGA